MAMHVYLWPGNVTSAEDLMGSLDIVVQATQELSLGSFHPPVPASKHPALLGNVPVTHHIKQTYLTTEIKGNTQYNLNLLSTILSCF